MADRFAGRSLAVSLGLVLAACSPADNEPGPGGVTVGEARALDEAAEMLEQQRLPQEAVTPGAAPVQGPSANRQLPPQTLERQPGSADEHPEEPPPPPAI